MLTVFFAPAIPATTLPNPGQAVFFNDLQLSPDGSCAGDVEIVYAVAASDRPLQLAARATDDCSIIASAGRAGEEGSLHPYGDFEVTTRQNVQWGGWPENPYQTVEMKGDYTIAPGDCPLFDNPQVSPLGWTVYDDGDPIVQYSATGVFVMPKQNEWVQTECYLDTEAWWNGEDLLGGLEYAPIDFGLKVRATNDGQFRCFYMTYSHWGWQDGHCLISDGPINRALTLEDVMVVAPGGVGIFEP